MTTQLTPLILYLLIIITHAKPINNIKPSNLNFNLDTILHRPIHSNVNIVNTNQPLNVYANKPLNQLQLSFNINTSPITPNHHQPFIQQFINDHFQSDSTIIGGIQPNITDKETVLSLAKMTANAYTQPTNNDWIPLDHFYSNETFGWTDSGLRGYLYTSENNTVVIATIKGTSAAFLGIGGDTSVHDKINDNRMFSCCCANVDRTWSPICGCNSGLSECDWQCLKNETNYDESYYSAGQDLYKAIALLYPTSQIWFTGHSLGGSVASLLAATYELPAITFEAPGERMYAQRLGLPNLKQKYPIYHFGHDADPIYMGRCRGPRSSCYYAGYAIETQCHLGKVCTYRVMNDNDDLKPSSNSSLPNWGLDIRHHRIHEVIDYIIEPSLSVPDCVLQLDCQDCLGWSFV